MLEPLGDLSSSRAAFLLSLILSHYLSCKATLYPLSEKKFLDIIGWSLTFAPGLTSHALDRGFSFTEIYQDITYIF